MSTPPNKTTPSEESTSRFKSLDQDAVLALTPSLAGLWDFQGISRQLGSDAFSKGFVAAALLYLVVGVPIGLMRDMAEPSAFMPWQATTVNATLGLLLLSLRNRSAKIKVFTVVVALLGASVMVALRNETLLTTAVTRDIAVLFAFLAFGTLPAVAVLLLSLLLPATALMMNGIAVADIDKTVLLIDILVLFPVLAGCYALLALVLRLEADNQYKTQRHREATDAAEGLVRLNTMDLRDPLVALIQLAEKQKFDDQEQAELNGVVATVVRRLSAIRELAGLPVLSDDRETADIEGELQHVFQQLAPSLTQLGIRLLMRAFPLRSSRFTLNVVRMRAALVTLIRGAATVPGASAIDLQTSVEVLDDDRVLLKFHTLIAVRKEPTAKGAPIDSHEADHGAPEFVSANGEGWGDLARFEERVRDWVEGEGGWLRLESRQDALNGEQLMLIMGWPAILAAQGEPRKPLSAEQQAGPVESNSPTVLELSLSGKRVLLVDDDPLVRKMSALLLKNKLGAEVDQAASGREGWQKFLANPGYALVLTDFIMPDGDGMQLLKNIRATNKEVLVVVITLSALVEDKVQLLSAGANAVVTKPLKLEALVAELQSLQPEDQSGAGR